MRQFSRKFMYTCTAMAAILLSGVGVVLGSYKTVKLNVDGQIREIHTFKKTNVAELLKQEGVALTDHDEVQPSRTTTVGSSTTIWIDHAHKVTIQDASVPSQVVYTRDKTVASLLADMGVEIGQSDEVNVRLDAPPVEGQSIIIKRHSQNTSQSEESIPFQTERQPNSSMNKGEEKVLSPGVEGLARITTYNRYENGKLVNTDTKREVIKEPQNKVVEYGTADRPVMVASRSGDSFSFGANYTMVATGYSAPGGRTASGLQAQHGVVAVDPNVIPLGTHLYIEGYGYAVAADTGGAIVGNKIDLCFDSEADAINFGRRGVSVHIVK